MRDLERLETLLKEEEVVLEAPFLGRTINEIVKKFEGLESLNTRYKLGED